MEKVTLCEERVISIIETSTPVLIPSFSSKGIKQFDKIFYSLKDYLSEVTLFSAYDLYYKLVDKELIYETDMLFIDSGGYEASIEPDLSEIFGFGHNPNDWKEELYLNQIDNLEEISNIVLINYDYPKIPFSEQVNRAKSIFTKYPSFASDFLIKPDTISGIFDMEKLLEDLPLCSNFSVIGFTEKELGLSVFERCRNIYKIRKRLNQIGLNKPIHIFGCLDPLNIITYFLCGADIFDGLSWLRYGFQSNRPIYINSYAISSGKWMYTNDEVRILTYLENIKILNALKHKMKLYIKEKDLSVFELDQQTETEIFNLMEIIKEEGF